MRSCILYRQACMTDAPETESGAHVGVLWVVDAELE